MAQCAARKKTVRVRKLAERVSKGFAKVSQGFASEAQFIRNLTEKIAVSSEVRKQKYAIKLYKIMYIHDIKLFFFEFLDKDTP